MPSEVTIRTPSTVGNFGPGFDVTSLAIAWGGDRVTARSADTDRVTIEGPGSFRIPTAWESNCAAAAFSFLRDQHAPGLRVHLHIEKGAPPGSGLGSSASSSAAGALAFARLQPDHDWTAARLVEAATYGESRVAGAHGDDVAAAVQGGLSLVRAGEVRRIDPPKGLHVAVARPDLVLETKKMRAVVGPTVPVKDATATLANVAFLIDAMHRNDIPMMLRSLEDRIAALRRREHIPFYEAARVAAQEAGAPGIAISGSGPALFTLAESLTTARDLAKAMADAIQATGTAAEAIATTPEHRHVWKEELGL